MTCNMINDFVPLYLRIFVKKIYCKIVVDFEIKFINCVIFYSPREYTILLSIMTSNT